MSTAEQAQHTIPESKIKSPEHTLRSRHSFTKPIRLRMPSRSASKMNFYKARSKDDSPANSTTAFVAKGGEDIAAPIYSVNVSPDRRNSSDGTSSAFLLSAEEFPKIALQRSSPDSRRDEDDSDYDSSPSPVDYFSSKFSEGVKDDDETVRPAVVARDFGASTGIESDFEGRSLEKGIALPSPSAQLGSGRWAQRIRQRSSERLTSPSLSRSNSLTPAPFPVTPFLSALSPRSPAYAFHLSSLRHSVSGAANAPSPSAGSVPGIPVAVSSLRSPRPARKNLDDAIPFDRIRSPALHKLPSINSLADFHDPFGDSRAVSRNASPVELPSSGRTNDGRTNDYYGLPPRSRQSSSESVGSVRRGGVVRVDDDSDSDISYDDEEYDDDLGPMPEVPPALEYVDPEIACIVPSASTATLPLAEAVRLETEVGEHPWQTPPYNIVEREQPRINKWVATPKITISLLVVISLIVGYGSRIKLVTVGPWSFGMYGLLLVIDFTVQTIAASFNRRRVNQLTKESPLVKGVAERQAAAKDEVPTSNIKPLPEASIAVVGYREDEEAWVACLKSLQAQEYPIKHIIGVVDGNDGPDLDMANAFGKAFPENERFISHLPVLLSVMYKEKYWEHLNSIGHPPLTRWQHFKMWLTQDPRPGQEEAHQVAWNHMLNYVHMKAVEERWADWKGICFSQPHGHKRHAMFTAFVVGAYALGTKDAILTTDSDTYVYPDAVKNMMALLFSDPRFAGVTGDVRIWNKSDSFLALMSSIRYWFAFNVERACQSAFGCVGCLSGPLGLYKTSDLMSVLGPWILQTFLGKETTFGDDRHLSNRILSLGHKTGYTHLAMCDSDTPAGYVRWVKQQTRWSKSFFREAFWFPKSFAYHKFWLTVETTKQFMYPMVLTATVVHMLYAPTTWIRPLIWLATMFGVAVIKSIYGVICLRDPRQFLFGIYGFMYFFGLLPSKLFACFTVHITNWGTSARSKSEFARPESFLSRTTHVGHLVVWYLMLSVGLGYFLATVFHSPYFWAVGVIGLALSLQAYSDVIVGETKYHYYVLRKKWKTRRAAKAGADVEKGVKQKKSKRAALKAKLRRKKAADQGVTFIDLPLTRMPPDGGNANVIVPVAVPVAQDVTIIDTTPEASYMPSQESFPLASHLQLAVIDEESRSSTESLSSNHTGDNKNVLMTPEIHTVVEPTLGYYPMSTVAEAVSDKFAATLAAGGEKRKSVIVDAPLSPGAIAVY